MKAIMVVDLGFGDAGKGSLVDYLVRREKAHTVIRFNGGAQAAHNVVTPEGRHHTFSQFGSGSFVPGVRTHLSRFMLFDPLALVEEERHLREVGVRDAFARLSVDARALVVSPFQRAANRLRELVRGAGRHGSCGMGIGETMADLQEHEAMVIRAADLRNVAALREKLQQLRRLKLGQMMSLELPESPMMRRELALLTDVRAAEEFAEMFAAIARRFAIVESAASILHQAGTLVFEGAQGVLLDEWYGFHPYTTWSTTTFANAIALLQECGYRGEVVRMGVMRAYMTRHGAGPLVTEDAVLSERLQDAHNRTNPWQREFRVGWPDMVMMRYALDVTGGVDELAVTCMDRVADLEMKVCVDYSGEGVRKASSPDLDYQEKLTGRLKIARPRYERMDQTHYLEYLEKTFSLPVTLVSHGPTWRDKRECRGLSGRGA